MISIKGINKYTTDEKIQLKLAFFLALFGDTNIDDVRCNCVNGYACTDCKYKHLCKDINDLLKSGILD